MADIPGIVRPEIQALSKATDRMTFLYLEHCKINRQDSAITVFDEKGVVHIPSGMISVLLLGPGTEVTHSSRLILKQAELVTNQRSHLDVVRKMYLMLFPACAGVILTSSTLTTVFLPFPRMCGGDPLLGNVSVLSFFFFPHVRG